MLKSYVRNSIELTLEHGSHGHDRRSVWAVNANSTSRLAVLYREQLIGGRRQKPRPGSPTNGPKRDRPSCAMVLSYWPQSVGWWVFGR